jgi:hypothetical protein
MRGRAVANGRVRSPARVTGDDQPERRVRPN